MTTYKILSRRVDGAYTVAGEEEASSAYSAIRHHFSKHADADGVYVAVPVRSWVEEKVSVRHTARVVIEKA